MADQKKREQKIACLADDEMVARLDRVAAGYAPGAGALSRAQALRLVTTFGLDVAEQKMGVTEPVKLAKKKAV